MLADPAGRASNAVTRYKDLAEKHNIILCSSYAVKNGPVEPNLHLLDQLLEALRVDQRMVSNPIYLAGFSGGSRLVSAFSIKEQRVKGVIACGSGFLPGFADKVPEIPSYTGVIGVFDMNFTEMANDRLKYLDYKWEDKLITGAFAHIWPPADVFELARINIQFEHNYEAAENYLKAWSALAPESPFPYYLLAQNYMRLGKSGKAKKEIKKALKKDDDDLLPDTAEDELLRDLY